MPASTETIQLWKKIRMRFYPHEKLALVVDGQHTWNTAKTLKLEIDWGKVVEHFARQATLTSTRYFTRLPESPDFNPVRPLVDWLEFNGWQVVTEEGDISVNLSVDVMEMAIGIDHFILVTGDALFVPLVEALKRKGRRVTILGSLHAGRDSTEDALRRAADGFLDLHELRVAFARTTKEAVPA